MTISHFSKSITFFLSLLFVFVHFDRRLQVRCNIESEASGRLGDVDSGGVICSSKDSRPKDTILCVGMLSKRVIVLTKADEQKDQFVYDLPLTSLNASVDKLFISADAPTSVREKWPTLYHSQNYTRIVVKGLIYNSFVAIDSVSEYLLLTTDKSAGVEGVIYDIANSKLIEGLYYDGTDVQVQISSDNVKFFHAIHKKDNGLQIMRYHFRDSTVEKSIATGQAALVPDDTDGQFYPMMAGPNDTIMITHDKSAKSSLNWGVMKGFLAEKKFYLFGPENIFIFPQDIYDQMDVPVKYSKIAYADFIQCSGNVVNAAASKGGLSVGIIIALVLLILIGLLCVMLFCFMRKKPKRKHSAHSATSKGTLKKASSTARSSRSKIQDGAGGKLSARVHSKKTTRKRTSKYGISTGGHSKATGRSGLSVNSERPGSKRSRVIMQSQSRAMSEAKGGSILVAGSKRSRVMMQSQSRAMSEAKGGSILVAGSKQVSQRSAMATTIIKPANSKENHKK